MGRGSEGAVDRAHVVVLSHPFCMDQTEVTVAAYRRCVERGACTVPQLNDQNSNYRPEFDRPKHPINMVNWMQAKQYCEAHGQALPTEAQWEWAAGHGDGRKYPWGDQPEPTCENGTADFTPGGSPKTDPAGNVGCHGGGSSEVGAHPNGKTTWPAGDIHDLAGNLWEWTADCYLPYGAGPVTDPSPQEHPELKGDCYVRALRGGGWNRSITALQPRLRAASKRTYRVPALGFRCVRNASK
jgi:formylglycine-generating enzyme required for sulfatase activity